MKFSVITDLTFRACTPDDPECKGYYGSEQYHACLVQSLAELGHEVEWYAPAGSTPFDDKPNVKFHPLHMDFGKVDLPSLLEYSSYEKLSYKKLLNSFVIDMTGECSNIEYLHWWHGYKNYVCYRNGYAAFNTPRLAEPKDRHYITPSNQNARIFAQGGMPSMPLYYGIPPFYCPNQQDANTTPDERFQYFEDNYGLECKNFFLFLHRPTPDKGINIMYQLAKDLPKITFVVAGHQTTPEHNVHQLKIQRDCAREGIENLKFVGVPMNPKHHYYKRSLYRAANAFMAPFEYPKYIEGFGLANAEAVACGTPLIVTNSPSTQELWHEGKDAIYIDSYLSCKYAVEYWDSIGYSLKPENHFPLDNYGKSYVEVAKRIINKEAFN